MKPLIIAVLFAGASCGGYAAGAPAPPAKPEAKRIRVACIGDSITFGTGAANRSTDSYPAQLQKLLGSGYEVMNFGVGGCTLIRKGTPNVWTTMKRIQAENINPDLVVVSLGTNDTCGGKRKCWDHKDDFAGDYRDLIDALHALPSKPRIWICAPTPMVPETPGLDANRKQDLLERGPRLHELITIIKGIAKEKHTGFIDLNTPLTGKADCFTAKDGVHPNNADYTIIAGLVQKGLQIPTAPTAPLSEIILKESPPPAPSRFTHTTPVAYPDGRPGASRRLDAVDQGVILKHGDGPGQCDLSGAREALIFEEKGVYHLFYDGAGPNGWLACLATSRDLKTWTKKGPILDFGKPGEMDSAAACSPWVHFDGNEWHMFYLGTPHTSPAPDLIPAFPYLTLKARAKSLSGPWIKQPEVIPFRTKPGTYYADTASPGHIVKQGDNYIQFFSASMKRTLGIARTKDLNGPWTIDAAPILPPDEQVENSSLYFEPANQTWFLFTNHIGLEGGEYTDAVWVYWSKDINRWNALDKAVVLDGKNCLWSRKCLGMPSVIKVGNRLAIFYDAPGGDSKSHMHRDLGLAWLRLPLTPPLTNTTPKTAESGFCKSLEYAGIAVQEPGWHIWGCSPIAGKDGKIHLFVERWPNKVPFDTGWRQDSQIAHYVADKPDGPFRFADVCLQGTGAATWDKYAPSNAHIQEVDGKFVLLFIANANGMTKGIAGHTSSQCIGMAISDSLDGPWRKVGKDGLVLSPSEDPQHWTYKAGNGVNNPAFMKHPDGRYLLYYKSSKARMGVAIASKLEGPYDHQPQPFTNNQTAIEDGYAFATGGRFYFLTTDNHGIIERGGGLLWESADGITFNPTPTQGFHAPRAYLPRVDPKQIRDFYGAGSLQRPQVLMKDGKPSYLYVASGTVTNGGDGSVCIALRCQPDPATPATNP